MIRIGRKELKLFYGFSFSLALCATLWALQVVHSTERTAKQLFSLYLVGDGGRLNPVAGDLLKERLRLETEKHLVVFLGDNIYTHGLPPESDSNYESELKKLNKQLVILEETGSQAIFLPGNHDWGKSNKSAYSLDGIQRVKRQAAVVNSSPGVNSFAPANACPGPAIHSSAGVNLIAIDTQWLLFEKNEQTDLNANCAFNNSVFYERLAATDLSSPTILLSHHPLESDGKHGTKQGGKHCTQDIACPVYQTMIYDIKRVLKERPVLICASGHDHSLQVLEGDAACKYYLVSGALSNTTPVERSNRQLFGSSDLGLLRVDFFEDALPQVHAFTVNGGAQNPVFSMELE